MGIKDLFNNEKDTKVVSATNKKNISEEIESEGYYTSEIQEKNKFEPHVDYSLPRNFAKFGSAKKYYEDSITGIYTTYPFDGSKKNKTQWMLTASGIDRYIFENEYPRTNGYIDFSYGGWGSTSLSTGSTTVYALPSTTEYITIYGGPNKDPNGSGKTLASIFANSSSNFYDVSDNRESNLEFADGGNTVEWWMKKDAFVAAGQQEVVFDLWSSGSTTGTPAGDYGRFAVLVNSSSSPIHLSYLSGIFGINASFDGALAPTAASIADGNWHHYAISANTTPYEYLSNTKSILFDGAAEYIEVGAIGGTADIGGRTNTSLSLWCKMTSLAVAANVYGNGTAGNTNRLKILPDGTFQVTMNNAGGTTFPATGAGLVAADTWCHLVFTYDSSDTTNGAKLYINGVIQNGAGDATNGALDIPTQAPALASGRAGTAASPFPGNIDEPSFWDRTLSASEVLGLYNNGTPTDLKGMPGLICWYRMGDDPRDSTDSTDPAARIYDQVGSNNGTPVDMESTDIVEDVAGIGQWGRIKADLYVDGVYKDSVSGSGINEVTGALIANVGSYYEARAADDLSVEFTGSVVPGWCKLSASIDEFRFWKTARTDKQIGMNWFTQVGGGTNIDDANTDLGVYYKFNEGITQTVSIDSKVLDYSGRFSDGTWTGYSAGARSTGSAMVDAGATDSEFKDPIIYSFHPEVVSLSTTKAMEGTEYDYGNASSIYYSIPSWIIEEDDTRGDLLNLTQIISSFFDSLQLKIQDIPRLKDVQYVSSSQKPYPFTKRGIESLGFTAPDLFVESTLLENVASRNETENFDEKIYNIKNVIYQNIYNNLLYIYKTKGTAKSFRNLMRCYGIDEELMRVNLYIDGATYDLEDGYKIEGLDKKFVNFAGPDRFNGSVYQTASSDISNSVSFLTASTFDHPMTVEVEAIFPKKFTKEDTLYFETNFVSSSLFGIHTAKDDGSDYTWETGDPANFQVYSVRNSTESAHGKFVLKSTSENSPFPTLETEIYKDLYDNTNWNFAVRLKQEYEILNTGSVPIPASDNSYILEFYGVETEGDYVRNEFILTSSLAYASGSNFIKNNKRLYTGAHRTNFTGSTLEKTDVKITSNRVWYSYLDSEVMRVHGKDSTNYGTKYPFENTYALYKEIGVEIPSIDTLALHWGYNTLSSSDGGSGPGYTAGFHVDDLSSGSTAANVTYGSLDDVLKKEHPGRGNFFLASDTDAITKEYLSNAKLQGPETMQSDDLIQIINGQDDQIFTRESRPQQFRYAIEKGMHQVISDEMINVFGSIIDFNNLIGEPVNRYRQDYQDLGKLRQIFFSRVKNTPNLIKYVDFFKWIDGSITEMLQQLIPATSNFSPDVATVVESHILERNKYYNKFPTIEFKENIPEDAARGINELCYPWKEGHAPQNGKQNTSCFWWRNRATPGQLPLNPDPDSVRSGVISIAHSSFQRELNTLYRFSGDGILNTDEDANDLSVVKSVIKFGAKGFISISADDVALEEEDCTDGEE